MAAKPQPQDPEADKLAALAADNQRLTAYIRAKTNHLLQIMGTSPLQYDELDDQTLIELDPIGIIADSFSQILDFLNQNINELQQAKDELEAIFDTTGVGISIIDRDFNVQRCNEKQRQLLVDPDRPDIIGHSCFEIYCARDSPGMGCPAMETFATGRPALVRDVKKKNKYFNVITTPFAKDADGTVSQVIEVALDITDKKQAELAEQQQRQYYLQEKNKLATVIESLSEGLLVVNPEGVITTCNHAAVDISGYPEEALMNQALAGPFPALAELLATGQEPSGTEFTHRTPAGEERLLSADSNRMPAPPGEGVGRVITFRDITTEKKKAQMLFRAEKLAAIGQLSAGVAHELNTPLASILGYARLLIKDDNLTSAQQERLEIIAEQTRRSSTIIKALLSFAREARQPGRTRQACDLNGIIEKAIPLLTTDLEKRRIELELELQPLPPVIADPGELEQVVINLVLNGMQAIGQEGRIRVSTSTQEQNVLLQVADNGPGITPEHRSRIFDPFYSTKPVGEGTGLGLSICAGIIGDLGGSIEAAAARDGGAALLVSLPGETSSGAPFQGKI
ncbi:PAS domain-containing sensor histidine kinase [Desulfurivibrio alkaliphilus]|uniref:histidine kinase n=1 Tax=Desulfurivibrio alkaliphilus (strain DSM 19089 / UNIQEM U267 / AHT2) TaxID=589865 RepID=D6Z076_DESAT|nr:PAS domain-containing sensor histidine kinase [Desulfurivibrio alkaliphilus]ADH87109.1 PAS/PAC sensor signal transduction histidine kinase [Desulfurivibrio alkaliphilus AHT 2]